MPLTAEPELTKTILPPISLRRSAGSADLMAVINEKKLTSKWVFQADKAVESPMRHKGSNAAAFRIRPSI